MESLIRDMSQCYQTSGINMIQHGEMVRDEYHKLIENLPEGILDVRSLVLPRDISDRYQLYHDCGKPYCQVGSSFPDHARISSETWLKNNPDDHIVAELIAHDMDAHMGQLDWNTSIAPTLYLTAWAELFANAKMFGGVDSVSFKIKRKRLIKVGKQFKLDCKEKENA